jgi:competence protein ComEC
MDWWLASFFLGAIFSLFLPLVPDLFVLFSLLLLSVIFFYSTFSSNKPLRLTSGMLFGASWMLFNALNFQHLWQKNNLDAIDLSTKPQLIQGNVLSLLSYNKETVTESKKAQLDYNRLRFNVNVTHINKMKLNKALTLRLSWKNATLPLHQGQSVQLKVKFKPAHGLANLGSFSYQTWLNSKEISATGYVVNYKGNQVLTYESTLRQQLFSAYKELLPDHELAPLLLALGFGSRAELNQDLWQILQTTGTGHLIAISGLHIGLVATGFFFIVMMLIRTIPLNLFTNSYKLQALNTRYYAIGLSMVIAISYGYLAGFSLPTVRALVMLIIYWCTRLLAIKLSIKRWLLLTLFVITLTTPFSLFTASFWLSVYAVTIIFLTLWRFKSRLKFGHPLWRFIKGLLYIQLSLTVLLLPISAVFFQKISVVALFANIIAVPWMSFLTIPLCLMSVLVMPVSETLSQFFIMLCLESVQVLWYYLTYLSTKPWAVIALSSLNVHLLVIGGLLSILFLFFQPKFIFKLTPKFEYIQKNKMMSAILCCFVIFSIVLALGKNSNKKSRNWQLVVFDVGQGLSVLIQRDHKAILYDTGASYDSGFNMIDSVVLPYLQHSGVQQLDKVVISHSDNDHAGGLDVLEQSIVIKELIYNANSKKKYRCLQDESFHWQGLTFQMIWPDKVVYKENDDSCVLLITDGKHKVLLTGDISKKVEGQLIQQYPQMQADVLIVPHHGSKTSSSDAFVSQVSPTFAIVSAGFLNRWHMPVSEVTNRYQDKDIQLLNSAESGQIIINFSEKGMVKQTYHENLWPFWFAKTPETYN